MSNRYEIREFVETMETAKTEASFGTTWAATLYTARVPERGIDLGSARDDRYKWTPIKTVTGKLSEDEAIAAVLGE